MFSRNRIFSRAASALLGAAAITLASVVPTLGQERVKINVPLGQSITHRVASVKTVSIANSNVADVVVAGRNEILINGKGVGITTLVTWDENDRSTMFDVVVRGQFSDQKIELRV